MICETITDTSGNALVYGLDDRPAMLLAEFVSQGPQPNPFFGTYVQSHINSELSRLANVASTAAANAGKPIHLTGTIRGTYFPTALWSTNWTGGPVATSTITETNGAGSISPLGHVTYSGAMSPFADLKDQGRTFDTKQGQVGVDFDDLQRAGTRSLEGEYTIDGGSGAYSRETGSGHVQITWTGSISRGKITEVYS
jgi:hypothetical protein